MRGKTAEPPETNATTSLSLTNSSRRRADHSAPGGWPLSAPWRRFRFPLANLLLGLPTKDYGLWYQVGRLGHGLDVYPRPETGRLFPFMYPPVGGGDACLAQHVRPVRIAPDTSADELSSMGNLHLAVGVVGDRQSDGTNPLVLIVPSLSVVVLVYNIYLLGQPNLVLLALLLGSFACLRIGRPNSAGSPGPSRRAIKAFPILALGYLVPGGCGVPRAATVAVLAAWLLIAPLPFRTPAQAVDDRSSSGLKACFSPTSTNGIAQPPISVVQLQESVDHGTGASSPSRHARGW